MKKRTIQRRQSNEHIKGTGKTTKSRVVTMKKFIFEEKFISYANVEIYAENEEDARLQFQNGNYQYYDISDFTDGHELIGVTEEVCDS